MFVDANLNSGDPDKYDYFKDGLVAVFIRNKHRVMGRYKNLIDACCQIK